MRYPPAEEPLVPTEDSEPDGEPAPAPPPPPPPFWIGWSRLGAGEPSAASDARIPSGVRPSAATTLASTPASRSVLTTSAMPRRPSSACRLPSIPPAAGGIRSPPQAAGDASKPPDKRAPPQAGLPDETMAGEPCVPCSESAGIITGSDALARAASPELGERPSDERDDTRSSRSCACSEFVLSSRDSAKSSARRSSASDAVFGPRLGDPKEPLLRSRCIALITPIRATLNASSSLQFVFQEAGHRRTPPHC